MKSESVDLPEELFDVHGNNVIVCRLEGNLYCIYPNRQAYINHREDKVIEAEYFIVTRDKLPVIRSTGNKNYKLLKDKYQ